MDLVDSYFDRERTWLAGLKAGDEVVVEGRGYYGKARIAKVDRITPSGRIVVGDRTFNVRNGQERGGSRYDMASLREPTDALKDEIEKQRILDRLGNTQWDQWPLAKLREVAALLK